MMRIIFHGIVFLFLVSTGFAQHKIEGTIVGHIDQNVTLLEYFGDSHHFVDSTRTDENGWFSFDLPQNPPAGLYSLAIGKMPLFNFIFNREDIILKFEPGEYNIPEFIFSIDNLIYYDYLVQSGKYRDKSAFMTDILQFYPERDSFYQATVNHFFALQEDFRKYTDRILAEYPHTFVWHIVRSDRPVMIPKNIEWNDFMVFNRQHYLDGIDFTDTLLINTNILTGKAIEYLGLYSSNQMSKEVQERYFMQAVDTLLHKTMDNGRVYDFLMQYLIEGFDRYGFDKVISHIAENYEPAGTCVNENSHSELQTRIENLRRLAIGKQAPEIKITQKSGNTFTIGNIEQEYVLVLFWASWCPHCEDMIPQIKKVYQDNSLPGFEVLAVSIDTNVNEYSAALAKLTTAWINHCDFKGWDTQAAIDYSIYATPTMFLLGNDRTILARPVNAYELRNELSRLK